MTFTTTHDELDATTRPLEGVRVRTDHYDDYYDGQAMGLTPLPHNKHHLLRRRKQRYPCLIPKQVFSHHFPKVVCKCTHFTTSSQTTLTHDDCMVPKVLITPTTTHIRPHTTTLTSENHVYSHYDEGTYNHHDDDTRHCNTRHDDGTYNYHDDTTTQQRLPQLANNPLHMQIYLYIYIYICVYTHICMYM